MHCQKKGFTLAELLVVVMIIGILGIAIVPKFNKMFTTRQTTEAEDMLSAVRQEQVMRCLEGMGYTGNVEDLSALDSLPKSGSGFAASKYFRYDVLAGGFAAAARGMSSDIGLAIPSYQDGRICCFSGCDWLNKDYVLCEDLVDAADFVEDPRGCF